MPSSPLLAAQCGLGTGWISWYNLRKTVGSNRLWPYCLLVHELKIAVDIDGVLADQVGAALKAIEKEYGLRYRKSDVNRAHWTFSGREIWSEISRLLANPEYTLNIPLIEGSQDGIGELAGHSICVVTARRPNAEEATRRWLNTHFPSLTEYYHARTGSKHSIPSDVLIDDLDLNIVEFVKSHPSRRGILFLHPWSINGPDIENYSDQVHFCPGWKSAVRAIRDIYI
jgi:5'(3')-deoxyribonucleotidase